MRLTWNASHIMGLLPLLTACLPVDGRPPPGRAVVTVSADQDLAVGLTTVDGWSIRYDRFLVSLGNVWLDRVSNAGRCDEYSQHLYLRIIDLREPGPHRLRTLFALGDCVLRFQLTRPSEDVLVSDVSEEVEHFMRTAGEDASTRGGLVLSVAGSASRAGTIISFDWSFAQSFDYETCEVVRFEGDTSQTLDIQIQSRTLFHDHIDPEMAQVSFEPFAAADADADGTLSVEELDAVPVSDGSEFRTMWNRMYLGLVPQLPWLSGQKPCFAGKLP